MQISYLQKIASVFQVDNGDPNRYFSVYTMNNFLNAFGGKLFLHYPVRNFTFDAQVSKRFVEVWKVAGKTLRWNVLFFFDTHGVLFTVRISGASLHKHVGHSALLRYLCWLWVSKWWANCPGTKKILYRLWATSSGHKLKIFNSGSAATCDLFIDWKAKVSEKAPASWVDLKSRST